MSRVKTSTSVQHNRQRYGASLVELVVAMSIMSILISTTGIAIARLLRSQSSGAKVVANSLSTTRLARDLRRDAHLAEQAVLTTISGQPTLLLQSPHRSDVSYRVTDVGLERQGMTAAKVATRESYRLPDSAIDLTLEEHGRLIKVTVRSKTPQDEDQPAAVRSLPHQMPRLLEIVAAIAGPTGHNTPVVTTPEADASVDAEQLLPDSEREVISP